MIIFSIIYIVFLFAYFITRVKDNKKYRIINKYILASMYLVYAVVILHFTTLQGYHYIMLLGILFAYLGDLILVYSLNKGGAFFLLSNLTFSSFYLVCLAKYNIPFLSYFWVFIITLIIITTFILLSNKFPNVLKLKENKYPMTIYLSTITLHGLLGLSSIIFINTIPLIVMGIGSILFMISDYILTIDRFVIKNNKWLIRCNSLTYFIGLLLIVLSLGL